MSRLSSVSSSSYLRYSSSPSLSNSLYFNIIKKEIEAKGKIFPSKKKFEMMCSRFISWGPVSTGLNEVNLQSDLYFYYSLSRFLLTLSLARAHKSSFTMISNRSNLDTWEAARWALPIQLYLHDPTRTSPYTAQIHLSTPNQRLKENSTSLCLTERNFTLTN